jgi:hypothetical protein
MAQWKSQGKRPHGRHMRRWEDNINTGETGYEDGDSIGLGQDTVATLCEHGTDTVPNTQEISVQCIFMLLLKN